MKIRAVVAVAGVVRQDGNVFTEECLRDAATAYGAPYTYDEASKSLIYEGETPHLPPTLGTMSEAKMSVERFNAMSDEDQHRHMAMIALRNQPFGFSREDVTLIREHATKHPIGIDMLDRDIPDEKLSLLADRIEALLPPE